MPWQFPDLTAFCHAIQQGEIPPDAVSSPARGAVLPDGSVVVQLDSATTASGGTESEPAASGTDAGGTALRDLLSPIELVPPIRQNAPALARAGRSLIECLSAQEMVRLIGQLGKRGFRSGRFRLPRTAQDRFVVEYLDPLAAGSGLSALAGRQIYSERGARHWVEVGFVHPLLERYRPPPGRRVLVPASGPWRLVSERQFQRVEFAGWPRLPVQASDWADLTGLAPLCASIRFVAPKRPAEVPDFWVIADDGLGQLTHLVHTARSVDVERLDFAVLCRGDSWAVVLRVSPSRLGPPALVIRARACSRVLQIDSLYAPVDFALVPLPRRDYLRERLCRPGSTTCLLPSTGRGVQIMQMPSDAFRPLSEWVEYVSERPPRRLSVIRLPPGPFEQKPFQVAETATVMTEQKKRGRRGDANEQPNDRRTQPIHPVRGQSPRRPDADLPPLTEVAPAQRSPDEVLERVIALEKQFLAESGPLDSPARMAIWPELADWYPLIEEDEDASICWANALWEMPTPPAEWLARWFRLEWPAEEAPHHAQLLHRLLAAREPKAREVRAVAVCAIHEGSGTGQQAAVQARLGAVARFLADHESLLPVRVAWLAWLAVARMLGSDVLMLSRARDRILSQLLETGLHRDRDFPRFLRAAATAESTRNRMDAGRVRALHERAVAWTTFRRSPDFVREQDRLLDLALVLTFAFAIARLGDAEGCRRLLRDQRGFSFPDIGTSARSRLPADGLTPEARWLADAYMERIRQQIRDGRLAPALSRPLLRELGSLPAVSRQTVERFRHFSRVLEPHERADPYRQQRSFGRDVLGASLSELAIMQPTERVEQTVRALLKSHSQPRSTFRILSAAMPLAFRAGEALGLELLSRVAPTQQAMPHFVDVADLIAWVQLIETGLAVAAHQDRAGFIPELVGVLDRLLAELRGERAAWLCAALSGHAFRQLSRLGLRDQAHAFHHRLADAILEGDAVVDLLKRPALNAGVYYPALVRLACGWFYFGDLEPAHEVVNAVRRELFCGSMSPEPRVALACAYAGALGYAPLQLALPAYEELFARLPAPPADTLWGAVAKLRVAEALVLALTGEDFATDTSVRRLMDEDEYLVRRRIHRDVREALARSGL